VFELALNIVDRHGGGRRRSALHVAAPPGEWTAEDALSVLHEIMRSALGAHGIYRVGLEAARALEWVLIADTTTATTPSLALSSEAALELAAAEGFAARCPLSRLHTSLVSHLTSR